MSFETNGGTSTISGRYFSRRTVLGERLEVRREWIVTEPVRGFRVCGRNGIEEW